VVGLWYERGIAAAAQYKRARAIKRRLSGLPRPLGESRWFLSTLGPQRTKRIKTRLTALDDSDHQLHSRWTTGLTLANRGYSPYPSDCRTQQNQLPLVEAEGDSTKIPIPCCGSNEGYATPYAGYITTSPETLTSTGNAASVAILSSCCHRLQTTLSALPPCCSSPYRCETFSGPCLHGIQNRRRRVCYATFCWRR
jgi:hypothetical protein